MIWLKFFKNGEPAFKRSLSGKTSIGRDPSANICLTDEDISRIHCWIEPRNEGVLIVDESTNGILVNGKQIKQKIEVEFGESFQIGDWEIKIIAEEAEKSAPTIAREKVKTKIIGYQPNKKNLLVEKMIFDMTAPNGKKYRHETLKQNLFIGTSKKADIIIQDDDYASKQNSLFCEENGKYYLKDLKSTNGTFFSGQRVDVQAMPKSGKFRVGKTDIEYNVVEASAKIEKKLRAPLPSNFIAQDSKMREVLALIEAVSPSDVTILILGESGVGKEEVARLLHLWSDRDKGPFVAVNCAALTEGVVESALFGHEKGAFTGAVGEHLGVFEQANGGTLFLDEIGDLKLSMQGALLRVLENKKLRRMGGKKELEIDVRIVAGTNRNLKKDMEEKKFREDLYHRLNIIPITIPPLRERKDDIPIFIEHFMRTNADAPKKEFAPKALRKLTNHLWSGNVRQLRNYVLRLLYDPRIGHVIDEGDIEFDFEAQCASETYSEVDSQQQSHYKVKTLKEVERVTIINTLRAIPHAKLSIIADKLGISRASLHKKLSEYGIDAGAERKQSVNL